MRKLNEKPHVTRHGGQWVIEYQRVDDSCAQPNAPLRVRKLTCGNCMKKVQNKGRGLISTLKHYHRKIVAKKPRKF